MGLCRFWLLYRNRGSAFFLLSASLILFFILLCWLLLLALLDFLVLVAGLTIDAVVAALLLENGSSMPISLLFDILPVFLARAHPTFLLDHLTILVLLTT